MSIPPDLTDPVDLAVVQRLRDAGRSAADGLDGLDVDALLHRSHRSARRHQLATVAGGAVAAAAAAVLAVSLTTGNARPPAVPAGPATGSSSTIASAPSPTPSTTPSAAGPSTTSPTPVDTSTGTGPVSDGSLTALLGDGWSDSGGLGDVTLATGSPASSGLPDGFSAVAHRYSVPSTLSSLCRSFVEKGTEFAPCTPLRAPDGSTVQRQLISGADSPPGAHVTLRILRPVAGGQTEFSEVSASRAAAGTVDATTFAAASTWVQGWQDVLVQAVLVDIPAGQ